MNNKFWKAFRKVPMPILGYLAATALMWGTCIIVSLCSGVFSFVYGLFVQTPSATFFAGFSDAFFPIFFIFNTVFYIILCFDTLIKARKENSLKEKLATVLLGAIIFLIPAWYLGGRQTCSYIGHFMKESVGQFLEKQPVSSYQLGEKYFNIQAYNDATKSFKKAVFLDKYVVFWNDNSQLPIYYRELGRSLMNESDYEGMNKSLEASLEAYEKYRTDDIEGAAFVHQMAAISCSMIGNAAEELNHSQIAYDYYSSLPRGSEDANTSKMGIWLAHCYYEKGDHATAGSLFDINIPIYYDTIDWGIWDEDSAQYLALAYKFALLSYEGLGDTENIEKYQNTYEQFLYLRDFDDEEVTDFASQLGWYK